MKDVAPPMATRVSASESGPRSGWLLSSLLVPGGGRDVVEPGDLAALGDAGYVHDP